MALLDTPGWQTRHDDDNRMLNVGSEWATGIADAVIFVVTALSWTSADSRLLARFPARKKIIAAVNKIDMVADKNRLLPLY